MERKSPQETVGVPGGVPGDAPDNSAAGRILLEHKDSIIARYIRAARTTLSGVQGFSEREIIDSLPSFLDNLADSLGHGLSRGNVGENAKIGTLHARARSRLESFTLEHLLLEYRILRRTILETMRETIRASNPAATIQIEDIIHEAIDQGIVNSVAEFSRLRSESERQRQGERELLLNAVRQSEERLYSALMNAPIAIAVYRGPDLIVEFVNQVFRDAIGSDRITLGQPLAKILPELGQGLLSGLKRVIDTGIPASVTEFPFAYDYDRSGQMQEKIWNLSYAPLRNPEGQVDAVMTCASEVTDQVRLRNELSRVLNAIPASISRIDAHERVVFVNQYNERYTSPPWKLLGKTLREQLGASYGRLAEKIHAALRGERVEFEWASPPDSNGVPHQFKAHFVPERDVDGRVEGFVSVLFNIDDLKKTESSLKAAYSETQLQKQRLEEERVLRERFVASLAHDLRTPLAAALMSSQLLLRKTEDPQSASTLIDRINENLGRADCMIQDLLDTNRIQAGQKLPLEILSTDLCKVAEDTLDDLRTIYGNRFTLQAPRSILGYWDPGGIRRILENLCGNAVKYGAPHRPIVVSLQLREYGVEIRVWNEGPPIPREDITRLFEPFQRSHSAQASRQKGWGLGLTLVKGIAEALGGNARLESSEEAGTAFTVSLPFDARSKSA